MSAFDEELTERITLGVKLGAIRALTEHKRAGRSIAILQDGKVLRIPAEEIEIPELPQNYKKFFKTPQDDKTLRGKHNNEGNQ